MLLSLETEEFSVNPGDGLLQSLGGDCVATGLAMRALRRFIAAGTLVLTALVLPANAQQPLPAPAQPVPLQREQIVPRPSLQPQEAPALTVQPGVAGSVPPGARQVEVTLNAILLDGMSAYRPEQFAVLWQDELGKKVSLARVFEIAGLIERQYRADGYFLSRAYVPEQTVSDGRFVIAVVEGYIADVVVQGEVGDVRKLIQKYVGQIVGRKPITSADIERYLLLANDIPGITARGTLQPAEKDGASQLVVDATLEGLDGFATVNNRSSDFTGPWVGAVSGAINSQSELGERTEIILLNTLFTGEQTYMQGSLESRFGAEGFKVKGTLSYGPSEPGSTLKQLEVKAVSKGIDIEASYPILRSRRFGWLTALSFDLDNIETDASGSPFSADRLRVLRFNNRFEYRDAYAGVNALTLGIHKGLEIMGASTRKNSLPQSRGEGKSSFWKGTIEASRLQGLWAGQDTSVNLLVQAAAQYTRDPLLAAEEFRLGGEKFGRGYDPGELLGDRGIAGSVELQVNLASGNTEWFTGYQFYTFLDAGRTWNLDAGTVAVGLMSGGAGVRFQVTENASAEVELAQPISRNPSSQGTDSPPMMYFRMSTRF